MAKKNIITKDSEKFLENYLNNPSPTGFESEGQKLWLDYIKPYIDEYFVDTYGTARIYQVLDRPWSTKALEFEEFLETIFC